MKLIIFGATGMVGKSVLREALQELDIEEILVIGRESIGIQHEKLHEFPILNHQFCCIIVL